MTVSKQTTFQGIINRLTYFWAAQGCLVEQGYDLELGAGTFNPSTFLRALGPEPYNTVSVEPCRRPQDGRFGENPNRTQLFHQLQVVMKPSPINIQDLYLESLKDLGLDLKLHDIRFVHDDWESPTLGAWGLGWEVWLDGMEITQFTYFQSVAGLPLQPVSVELAYGLERLSMALQKKKSFFEMAYNAHWTYGDLYYSNEVEWSAYNFKQASTHMWLRHFDDYEQEAKYLLEKALPIPAYHFVMKASHAFNTLEARGLLSVTERTSYIARVRDLAKATATQYLASRKALGFPLLKKSIPYSTPILMEMPSSSSVSHEKERDDFLLEIGSEELPATFVPIGLRNLKVEMEKLLKDSSLSHDGIEGFGTPRRLAVLVKNLGKRVEETIAYKKGPALGTAFDREGNPTQQALGFFRSLEISNAPKREALSQLSFVSVETIKGKEYLMARVAKKGKEASALLREALPPLIRRLSFPKKMRWGSEEIAYARPLKWIVSLYGSEMISFAIGSLLSGNQSWGHAQLCPKSFIIERASDYVPLLKKHRVFVDVEERKRSIETQLAQIERATKTTALQKKKVLEQVLYLSEWPMLELASFDTALLKVPQEVLISEMVEHQKYFPLALREGALAPLFVFTADNTPNSHIKEGNENVLSARLSDGAFLYQEDLKISLDLFAKKLDTMIFQKALGTLAQKALRIKEIALKLHSALTLGEKKDVERAACLCKADLASELVQEFPDLQGTIGKYYALHQGEKKEVAEAIEQHYLPKSEGGALPTSPLGILLSLADKIDNLVSCFQVGLKPTSSHDPYALRRQAIGVIKILIEHQLDLDLIPFFPRGEVLDFLTSRARSVLEEYGFAKDTIAASLLGKCQNPYSQYLKTQALHLFRSTDAFEGLWEVYKRAKGQIRSEKQALLNPSLLQEPAEKTLYSMLLTIDGSFKQALSERRYQNAFANLSQLHAPLNTLFEQVRIVSDDPHLHRNRIALLQKVFSYFSLLLDFEKIHSQISFN